MFKFVVLFAVLAVAHGGLVGVAPILTKPALPIVTAPITTKIVDTGLIGLKTVGPIVSTGIISKGLVAPAIVPTLGWKAPLVAPVGLKGWL